MIGQESSRHPVNQSDAKVKTIATWSLAFSRASNNLLHFELLWEHRMCFCGACLRSSSLSTQIAMAESPPDIPESLNPALRDVLLRCFESKQDERPPATELLRHPLFTQMWKEVSYQLFFFFFLLKFSQLELLNRALSFVNAAHSNISPTCGRVVSLDPESVRIFPKVKTLCVMSAYLKVELDPGICDRGVRSLILKT